MAMKMTAPQTPEMVGLTVEQVEKIAASGGVVNLGESSRYIRFGGVRFPQPRHLVLMWEVWPSKEAARSLSGPFGIQEWPICPEPYILAQEERTADGEVLQSARVLPTYDAFTGLINASTPTTVADSIDQVRKSAYAIAKDWPDFAGAVEE